jgi:signal transduction histidine kinase
MSTASSVAIPPRSDLPLDRDFPLPARRGDAGNRRILVVDDNPEIHEDFHRILTTTSRSEPDFDALESELFGTPHRTRALGLDFELSYALQGAEALRLVDEAAHSGAPFAMIFQDMRMPPGWDGLETAERIWERHPDLDIVFCTAYSDHSWEEIVRRVGVTDHLLILKKPFDVIEVQQLALSVTTKFNLAERARGYICDLETAVRERTAHLKHEMEERERLRGELFRAQKLESIGQLASGIAHEINTPIQYVATNGEFLEDAFRRLRPVIEAARSLGAESNAEAGLSAVKAAAELADLDFLLDEIPGALAQAKEGVERVARIVRAMREFSHPGWKEKREADLNDAVRSTIIVTQNEWKHIASLTTDLASDLPRIPCVVPEINQALLNLIVNAAHAIAEVVGDRTQELGNIFVATRRIDDQIEIRIEDTGSGIDPAIADRVFDPFFTTKEVGKGTGQGLSVAYAIVVETHGGTIDFEPRAGGGTVFRIRIPIQPLERTPRLASFRSNP